MEVMSLVMRNCENAIFNAFSHVVAPNTRAIIDVRNFLEYFIIKITPYWIENSGYYKCGGE
ncbi:MAG: hypothetical protein ACP5G5_07835 [Thermoplasmata archaeon]